MNLLPENGNIWHGGCHMCHMGHNCHMWGVLLKAKVEAKKVLEKGSESLNGLNSFADNKIGWFKGKLGE